MKQNDHECSQHNDTAFLSIGLILKDKMTERVEAGPNG